MISGISEQFVSADLGGSAARKLKMKLPRGPRRGGGVWRAAFLASGRRKKKRKNIDGKRGGGRRIYSDGARRFGGRAGVHILGRERLNPLPVNRVFLEQRWRRRWPRGWLGEASTAGPSGGMARHATETGGSESMARMPRASPGLPPAGW